MYKIFADDTLIYDSTVEDYKIGKGQITLEINKSGSFVFSVYPDHFYYERFIQLKTVITVYKSGKIIFRGRILNDVTDYWNNKVITCEGEMGFLQDSIIRPFTFTGTPEELFIKFIEEHNSQVDNFKQFKIGTVTVTDPNNYISRSNVNYESAISNLNGRLIEDSLGGYFYITHGDDGTDRIPTINYLADFRKVSSQIVEFGSNLKKYTKTVKGQDIATAIIPLGAELDDNNPDTEDPRLTIASVNDGKDYVYEGPAVDLYGWVTKVVIWDDVTDASNLKRKAQQYLNDAIKQLITIELNAIDLHLLDQTIESFVVGDYIQVISKPHNFNSLMLCNRQTIDLLRPENDSLTLGYTYSAFTEMTSKVNSSVSSISSIQRVVNSASNIVTSMGNRVNNAEQSATEALNSVQIVTGDLETISTAVTENARDISKNAEDIATILAYLNLSGDSVLPYGYTQLSYIESSGTQYINANFKPNQNTRVVVDFLASTTSMAIVAVDAGWLKNGFGLFTNTCEFGTQNSGITATANRRIFDLNKGVLTVDGNVLKTMSGAFQSDYSLFVFALNRSNVAQEYMTGKIYSCKIYDNGTLVRNFIPCIAPGGQYGLYDIAHGQFYGNAGTGEFTGA